MSTGYPYNKIERTHAEYVESTDADEQLMKACGQKHDASTMIKKRCLKRLGHAMGRSKKTLIRQLLLAALTSSWKKKTGGQMISWHNVVRKDVEPLGGHKWDNGWLKFL